MLNEQIIVNQDEQVVGERNISLFCILGEIVQKCLEKKRRLKFIKDKLKKINDYSDYRYLQF